MKKIVLTVIAIALIVCCLSGCEALIHEKDGGQSATQSSEVKTSRKPVSAITDGGEFGWN